MNPEPITFRKTRPGVFQTQLNTALRPTSRIEISLELNPGQLEPYCRYARHREPSHPPTFLNTCFAESPPGTRVGPWPGWRGIPELPEMRLHCSNTSLTGKYGFQGDEEACSTLRAWFTAECILGGTLELHLPGYDKPELNGRIFQALPAPPTPIPVQLKPELQGRHPRLLVDQSAVTRLQVAVRQERAPSWKRLQQLASTSWDLPYETTPEGKVLPGQERLTGADRILISAAIALLQPKKRNLALACETYRAYLEETENPDFQPLGIDTQCGEILFLLCLVHDWLANDMEVELLHQSQARLGKIAEICRHHLDPLRRDYAQAHYLGCGLGLLAFSFLFWDEHPNARAWAAELRGAFARVMTMLPDDGFFPHGLNLWSYEHGFLLRWVELLEQCTGEALWEKTTAYFQGASRFRAAATSLDARYGVTFGDPQFRVTGDSWCHFLIATRTGSAEAAAMGETLLTQHPAGTDHRHAPPRRRVYELLWQPAPPSRTAGPVPPLTWFPDGGQVFIRREQTLVTLRSGPPLGRRRREAGEWGGYGHSDPCNGGILVWQGHTFAGSGPGPLYRRETRLQNLLTVDGLGQYGDSCVWFPDFLEDHQIPPTPEVTRCGDDINIHCDLTAAYLPHLGVRRCERTVRVHQDGSLSGVDRIELQAERTVAWHWHTWAHVQAANDGYWLTGPGCRGHLRILPSVESESEVAPELFVAAYPHDGHTGQEIKISCRSRAASFQWFLNWENPVPPGVAPMQTHPDPASER